jgi:hypothetical protein
MSSAPGSKINSVGRCVKKVSQTLMNMQGKISNGQNGYRGGGSVDDLRQPAESLSLAAVDLFQLLAAYPEERRYWDEFVRRYNLILVHGVYEAYQELTGRQFCDQKLLADTLGYIYSVLAEERFLLLRLFRRGTEQAAKAYLACLAVKFTHNYLGVVLSLRAH